MKVEQIYTSCLAQGAYYIESNGEAAIIDPLRDIEPYLQKAAGNNATIKYVLETHFHADFVSGHIDLTKVTGATLVFGPNAQPSYPAHIAKDGEELKVGKLTLKVLHTPGHTLESTTYLLQDENGKDLALFTGDTLFIGDVGRPDLAAKSDLSQADLAGMLFESLRTKIMPLADDVVIYPAHGAGSACGKNMSKETSDTLGNQKKTNYALRADMTKAEFIAEVTNGLLPPPEYFPVNVQLNKQGYINIDTVLAKGLQPLTVAAFQNEINSANALVLDTRKPQDFAAGFIPKSINIGIDGGFAPWVGTLLPDVHQPIILVADAGREQEVITRMARVGFDNILGFLEGGIAAWTAAGNKTETITSIAADAFAKTYAEDDTIAVIDVRKPGEFAPDHIVNARNLPLDYIQQQLEQFPKGETLYIHCAGGYRSMIAASILKHKGFTDLVEIQGGYASIKNTTIPRHIAATEVSA
ncbi:MBL fold metallo-hydrolase [Pontibacter arcticus]|uniref:MBL fold metallo-hydrolase n=1 Tax=Pontibacter arcticus TaxID=2080288 RepID=A0A364RBX8_9BACT|nr:MBL fold metallo-hydrolase [Pontibacter arcticus]RAU81784.1 MBL fold metallo-hydrolase [Pontibacter arcticus]